MPPESPAKEPLPLLEWVNFQFKEITAAADMLKDTCESIKKRKLDGVLCDLETKTVCTNKCTTSIVRDCHRIISEHVQTLLNIDGEMRKEFAARFPLEGKKIKYTTISVPSFCTIRPPTPETDVNSSPEKANSTFRKRRDVSDSELNSPTKVDTSGRRTRRKLNLSSDEDMFGKVNENSPCPPLEVKENSRDGKMISEESTLREGSSNELGPHTNSVENNDSLKNSKTATSRNQSGKSTPKKNKGSADSSEGEKVEKVDSPNKNKTMKTRKESGDDLQKKTRGNSVHKSADTTASVRTGRQLRQRTTSQSPSPPKVTKRESRTRLAKRSLRSQPVEPIEEKNTSDEESDNEELQKKKNDKSGRKRQKVSKETIPDEPTSVNNSDESEDEKDNQKPKSDSSDVEKRTDEKPESNMANEEVETDVKVKVESRETEEKPVKEIEETATSNAVMNGTVKVESSNSDDDESKPLSSLKKNTITKDEKKAKDAVLNESESDVSTLSGSDIDDNLKVVAMKSKPKPRSKCGIPKKLTEANILLEKCRKGKFPTTLRVTLHSLHPLILEELDTSGVIRLGRSVKGDDKDELNTALKSLCSFNPIVSTCDSGKKKRGRKPMPKSKRIEADKREESMAMSTDNDDTLEDTPPKKNVSVKFTNEVIVSDTSSDPDDLEVMSNKSSDGEGKAKKNVLDDSDSAKTKSKSKSAKNKKGKSGSYKTPVVEVDDDSEDSDVPVKKRRTRNTTVKSKSEGSSSEDFTRTKKKVLRGRNAKRSEASEASSGEESSGESKRSKRRKTRSKKKAASSSEGSGEEYKEKPVKKVRRRIHADSSEEDSNDENSTKTPENAKGRKNIRKVIRDKHLEKSTRQAGQDEEERKIRVAEKQRLFNEHFQAPAASDVALKQLVLDFEPDTKEPILSVDEEIVKKLKPHQGDGIRFMWNACFESVSKKGPGDGCILAHCMGLGKTLQTIGFLHTILTNKKLLKLRTALVICPLSTVGNWYNEFKMWLRNCDQSVNVHRLWESKPHRRAEELEDWKRLGGVGIIHYDAFRLLVNSEDKKGKQRPKPKELKIIRETLIDPGADIVICDEGHLLKNPQSQQSKSVNKVATRRRVVLTGTPLQNNLLEYHTMMQFVKPSLLGSRKEFSNRFVNPILNGQHKDSGERDVQIMKRRAHVLHKLLDGCVQRLDYTVLTPFLPPKYEYAITVNLTDIQKKLYQHYIENLSGNRKGDNFVSVRLFSDYQVLVKVWTHPKVLTLKSKAQDDGDSSGSENSLKDFIDDKSTTEVESTTEGSTHSERGSVSGSDSDWSVENRKKKKKKKMTREAKKAGIKDDDDDDEVKIEEPVKTEETVETEEPLAKNTRWYQSFLDTLEDSNAVEHSGKLLVLMEILRTCESIGDKVLVFSQFLTSLDLVEDILADIDEESCKTENENLSFPALENQPAIGRWRSGIEYFRIDGSTKTDDRQRSCDTFNQETASKAKLFLISTKAGGLGINLVGANRVVIFDASWNPSQDLQSIFRVFRFGQMKPCYVYRLLARGTMEEKIYNRQVVKLSLSCRVVDEQQIERHFHFDEIQQMYDFDANDATERPIPIVPKDRLLADLLISQEKLIFSYLEHDSLLENKHDEELTEEERKAAWEEYNNINEQKPVMQQMQRGYGYNMMQDPWIQQTARHFQTLYPGMSEVQYLLSSQQAKNDVQAMVNQWEYIHNDKVLEIFKVQYRAKFDLLFAKLSAQFGPTANWDTVLRVFPPQKINPTSYVFARPVKGTNLPPPQNFPLARDPKIVSISSNMSKIANSMVSSNPPESSAQPTAGSSHKAYPAATIVPSQSIFDDEGSQFLLQGRPKTKPSVLKTKPTSYLPPEVISIDN